MYRNHVSGKQSMWPVLQEMDIMSRKALSMSIGACRYGKNCSPEWLPFVVGNEECIEWREEEEEEGGGREG